MKKLPLIILLLLLLTGCMPGDPYALQELAAGYIQATRQAQAQYRQEATLSVAQTAQVSEGELRLLQERLHATETAWGINQAAGYATQTSVAATATAPSVQATQTVIALELGERQAEYDKNLRMAQIYSDVTPAAVFVVVVIFTLLLAVGSWRLFNWIIEWKDRRNSLYETRQGTVVFVNGLPERLDDYSRSRIIVHPGTEAQLVENTSNNVLSGRYDEVSIRAPDLRIRARELVIEAINRNGPDSRFIPGFRDLPNWTASKWMTVIDALRDKGAVEAQPGKGTITTYACLTDLLNMLESGRLQVE